MKIEKADISSLKAMHVEGEDVARFISEGLADGSLRTPQETRAFVRALKKRRRRDLLETIGTTLVMMVMAVMAYIAILILAERGLW